jgi:hypothetical protein
VISLRRLEWVMAERHQAVTPTCPASDGLPSTPTLGVHPLDHPAHYLEINSSEVGPALAEDVQHLLARRSPSLIREAFGDRACRASAQPVGELPG